MLKLLRSALLALLLFTGAVAVYSALNPIFNHTASQVQPQGLGSGLEVDTLQGISEAGIKAQAGWEVSGSNLISMVSGNVGIGVNPPLEKLHVAGKIRATEFCIQSVCKTSWS